MRNPTRAEMNVFGEDCVIDADGKPREKGSGARSVPAAAPVTHPVTHAHAQSIDLETVKADIINLQAAMALPPTTVN